MDRRDVLTGLGVVGITALAGCSTTGDSEELPTEQLAVDSVRVQLVSVQAADHIYVEARNEENISWGVLNGSSISYDSDLSGQYLYTEDSSGQEVGGVGSVVEYQKSATAGRVYVVGVLNEVETIISTYEFLPKGEAP